MSTTNNTNTKNPTWRETYQPHPAADVFPMLPADQLQELAEDIERNGMREPITFVRNGKDEELLLDGRNRLEAWTRLGRDPHRAPRRAVEGDLDPAALIISANIRRRHLTPKERVLLADKAIKAAEGFVGKVADKPKGRPKSHATKVAEAAEVSPRTARDVLSKEAIQQVEDSINEAVFGKPKKKAQAKPKPAPKPAALKPRTRKRRETAEDLTVQNFARRLATIKVERLTRVGVDALVAAEQELARIRDELS